MTNFNHKSDTYKKRFCELWLNNFDIRNKVKPALSDSFRFTIFYHSFVDLLPLCRSVTDLLLAFRLFSYVYILYH